jgi:hypothetical protein
VNAGETIMTFDVVGVVVGDVVGDGDEFEKSLT